MYISKNQDKFHKAVEDNLLAIISPNNRQQLDEAENVQLLKARINVQARTWFHSEATCSSKNTIKIKCSCSAFANKVHQPRNTCSGTFCTNNKNKPNLQIPRDFQRTGKLHYFTATFPRDTMAADCGVFQSRATRAINQLLRKRTLTENQSDHTTLSIAVNGEEGQGIRTPDQSASAGPLEGSAPGYILQTSNLQGVIFFRFWAKDELASSEHRKTERVLYKTVRLQERVSVSRT